MILIDPREYFKIADFLAKLKDQIFSVDICVRTAINRLYYGIFHLVQQEFGIKIPETKNKQCHAFVKKRIEETDIRSDYSDLEEYRVDVDYRTNNNIRYKDYEDALKIQKRIINNLSEIGHVPYDNDDEDFYFKTKI